MIALRYNNNTIPLIGYVIGTVRILKVHGMISCVIYFVVGAGGGRVDARIVVIL